MREGQGDDNGGGPVKRVTIAQAATLQGCHPNTVRSRVRAGIYKAEKVVTERGPTWMIDRDSLTNNGPTSAPQQSVSGVPVLQRAAIQELARQIVREAGIAQDTEAQAKLEGNRQHSEAVKTQVVLASGTLVGIAAVVGMLPSREGGYWLGGAVLLLIMALAFALMSLLGIAIFTVRGELFPEFVSLFAAVLTVLGLFVFAGYVLYNLPLVDREGDHPTAAERHDFWLGTLPYVTVGIVVIIAVFAVLALFIGWRRSQREDTASG